MYGLEVCKSLHLPQNFLEEAHKLRNKYQEINRNVLEWKTSHFNSKHLKGICDICNEKMSSEVHHLQHQQEANETGYINGFHKNHPANLLNVCGSCHDTLHKSSKQHVKKRSNGKKKLVVIENI